MAIFAAENHDQLLAEFDAIEHPYTHNGKHATHNPES
jgi:hypothetical protein